MLTVFVVAVLPDLIPVMSSDSRGEPAISDRFPWATIVSAAIPPPITVDEEKIIVLDDVIVPAIGNGKAVVVQIDKIRAIVDDDSRSTTKIDMEVEFRPRIGKWADEQHTGDPGCKKD